ncbi:hypothetical protein SAMN02745975_03017 [Geosporobacter subterraneus DSM 17957]|uniref:4Fe-4S ferredoxin-type domain-containing protein n=1 Tax=Geosporobacter subterraneus DSM 17957 TaxID=1121919 RepID=A0A1M6MKP2_9FIRM|nr:YdjY domain-containing protein [Geosporobacter subterraneus]SHJ84027.1 hypothetical protein SAMN02745975_03017 [Geosporobacter subterraneus DSM 17957]
MKKTLLLCLAAILILTVFVGCAPKSPSAAEANTSQETMVTDTSNKEVKILAEVNGKYFTESTRHGVVFKDGSNGEKSVLRGLTDEKEFHDALLAIGAEPGNNVTLDCMTKGVKVEGTKLDVFVTWEGLGKEIPFNDIITSSEPRPMDIRFGGNLERAKEKNTGCILCLDSCAVGITSNSSYETGASKEIKFFGNKEVLPADGTTVTVIFRIAQ